MEPLAAQLHPALPHLSAVGHTVLASVADRSGHIASADTFALILGLGSRHRLSRLLTREGLPHIEELCGWIDVAPI